MMPSLQCKHKNVHLVMYVALYKKFSRNFFSSHYIFNSQKGCISNVMWRNVNWENSLSIPSNLFLVSFDKHTAFWQWANHLWQWTIMEKGHQHDDDIRHAIIHTKQPAMLLFCHVLALLLSRLFRWWWWDSGVWIMCLETIISWPWYWRKNI